jgi:hypothetical protein
MIHTGTGGPGGIPKKKPVKTFLGKLQPVSSRCPAKPDVNFALGGSDFRTFDQSCLGKQLVGFKHTSTAARPIFSMNSRFAKSETIGPGPITLKQISSLKRQTLSTRRSAESSNFGTGTRDGALKLYAVYTYKKI